jgi:hypothetical protein
MLVESLVGMPRQRRLLLMQGGGSMFFQRMAEFAAKMGGSLTAQAARNWQKAFELMLPLRVGELERTADWIRLFPDTSAGRFFEKETLELIGQKTPAQMLAEDGIKFPPRIAEIHPQLYTYMDVTTLLDHATPLGNGMWRLDAYAEGRYLSIVNVPAGPTAKTTTRDILQLPVVAQEPAGKAYSRGLFKGTVQTADVADDFYVPRSWRHGHTNQGTYQAQDFLEIVVKDNPERGAGGELQFKQRRQVDMLVVNNETGALVNSKDELRAWLASLGF